MAPVVAPSRCVQGSRQQQRWLHMAGPAIAETLLGQRRPWPAMRGSARMHTRDQRGEAEHGDRGQGANQPETVTHMNFKAFNATRRLLQEPVQFHHAQDGI